MTQEKTLKISLASARKNANMTQKQVAEKMGFDVRTLSGYEKGYTMITALTFRKLCELYNIPEGNIFLPEEVDGRKR